MRINTPNIETIRHSNAIWPADLKKLIELQKLAGGQTILQQIEQKEQANIAASEGFDLVQGDYYESLVTDPLEC